MNGYWFHFENMQCFNFYDHIHRCMFASNFPVDRINGTFPQLITALEAILKPYSMEDKKKFFAGNAKKFYRL